MNKFLVKISCFFFLIVLFGVTACNKDDNEDTDQRDKFIGTWTCTETSSQNPNPINFSVSITKDDLTEDEIVLGNFYHLGTDQNVKLIVDYSNVSIPQQEVCNLSISGTGAYNNSKVNLIYYVNDDADIDTVNAVLNK